MPDHLYPSALFEFCVVITCDARRSDVGHGYHIPDRWRDRVVLPVIENGLENLIGSVHFVGIVTIGIFRFFISGLTGVFQVIFKPGVSRAGAEAGANCLLGRTRSVPFCFFGMALETLLVNVGCDSGGLAEEV